jgi:predicted polyphosphate/ATP-dependent NAD kinase
MERSGKRLGLIVNPIAGIGGRVGLKGSDGEEIQRRALALGAEPEAGSRAARALERMVPAVGSIEFITAPAEMGEQACSRCGLKARVVGPASPGATTAADTRMCAQEMVRSRVDLLLFAGCDGTARDICDAVGSRTPVLGIPAGVKIHSGVFAVTPEAAGELAAAFLSGRVTRLCDAEVLDLDEEAVRKGEVSPRLYGYLAVPSETREVQGSKTASPPGREASLAAIAQAVAERMEADCIYILGPGTTIRAITRRMGLEKTLVGVDLAAGGRILAQDAGEAEILRLIRGRKVKIVVTPIGGQGCIFGRGNQQIGPSVIREAGRDNILVVATPDKIHSLAGRPLFVDTGDPELDRTLSGYYRVITGYREEAVLLVSS